MSVPTYTKTEYNNGGTPAISDVNLNNNEDQTEALTTQAITEEARVDTLYEQRIAMILIYGL